MAGTHTRKSRFGTFSDTPPEVEAVRLELLRKMTPTERFALALEASSHLMEMALAGIRLRLPDAPREAIEREYARIILPSELFSRIYPDAREGVGGA